MLGIIVKKSLFFDNCQNLSPIEPYNYNEILISYSFTDCDNTS